MDKLKYKTRGDSSPQGKPKVYFCCHPKDFSRYFESISEELLKKQDCAIWYLADGNVQRDEQFFFDLKQMQLFVMPVTSALLYTDNPALREEFAFAIANHIPVLPLMQEQGLAQVFNEECGDLQYLDKYANDSTAINYDKKLETYLNSVLIGDELAKKIRAAFDAYVFLSYRKKDRKYAQELMQLIHKNDFCRDLAIWYDEFLTPGENFNDAIRTALEKSGLFVLAVTPNLVNEPNYIMSTEYPMARNKGKPILPAEMVPTDKKELQDKYEGIPLCTDARDEDSFVLALQDAVKDIALRENDSAEHNFFVGLAYLSGVDVEVDHNRAVALITSAANDGLVEAMDKLVEMYWTGMGIDRNYEAALLWQEKKISHTEAVYQRENSEENLHRLFWALITCGNYSKELDKLEQAKNAYTRAYQHIKNSSYLDTVIRAKQDMAIVYSKIGDIYSIEGDFLTAKSYYEKAVLVFQDTASTDKTALAQRDLFLGYIKLGLCYIDLSELLDSDTVRKYSEEYSNAKAYIQKALVICEELEKSIGTMQAKMDLAKAYQTYSLLHDTLDDKKKYCLRALSVIEDVNKTTNDIAVRRSLSYAYLSLGDIVASEVNSKTYFEATKEAKEYYQKALDITYYLQQETGLLQDKCALAEIHIKLYKLLRICLDEEFFAPNHLSRATEIYVEIEEKEDSLSALQALAKFYIDCSEDCEYQECRSGAIEYLVKAIGILERIAFKFPSTKAAKDTIHNCEYLGGLYLAEEDIFSAKYWLDKALSLRESLLKQLGTKEMKDEYISKCNELASECLMHKDFNGAKVYYEKLLGVHLEEVRNTGIQAAGFGLAHCYDDLADVYKETGDLAEAKRYYLKSFAIRQEIVQKHTSPEACRILDRSYKKLGELCLLSGDSQSAINYFEQELVLRKMVAEKVRTDYHSDALADCYKNLGKAYKNIGNFPQAEEFLKQCIQLRTSIEEKTTDPFDIQELANICRCLADVYKDAGDIDNAKIRYQEALSVLLGIIEEHPFYTIDQVPSVYSDIALNYYGLAQIMPTKVRLLFKNKERIEYLQKAAEIYETLCRKEPSNESYNQKLLEIRTLLNT